MLDSSVLTCPLALQFRLGYSGASGIAYEIDPDHHPHVFRVALHSVWTSIFIRVVSWLPVAIQSITHTLWPAYFLPDIVVLKKCKPNWDDEFGNEQDMYNKLEALQGRTISIYYGEARCEGTRALILSEVLGVNVLEQERPYIAWEEFERRLKAACGELAQYGVVMGDFNLGNIFFVHDRIMFVDLEMCYEPKPEVLEKLNGWSIAGFCDQYACYLISKDEDEL